MKLPEDIRRGVTCLLASLLACPPARALVALNDGRDRIYVSGSLSVSHDSNVFAANGSAGDTVYGTSLSAEYTRRAGWIGVNGSAAVSSAKFATIDGQDFANPSFSLEFTKQSGRTTGAITLSAARQSRADSAVNLRTESWNYNAGLGVRYPLSGTMTLAGNFGYTYIDYTGASGKVFSDLETYQAGLDVYRILSSERDLVGGYRYRHGATSRETKYSDHSFTAGLSGRLIRGINGSLRAGYQFRVPISGVQEDQFSSWTASGSASYALNKKMSLSATIAKDFATTAIDSFVDTVTASLDFQYAYSSRWTASIGTNVGDTRFLGESGRVVISSGPPPVLGPERHDTYASWNAALNYSMNEHLRVTVAYSWFRNWSTSSFADFVRSGYSLTLSSRW